MEKSIKDKTTDKDRGLNAFGEVIQNKELDAISESLEKKMIEQHRETQTKLRKSEQDAREVILNS